MPPRRPRRLRRCPRTPSRPGSSTVALAGALVVVLGVALGGARGVGAQGEAAPRRPRLEAAADTNDARTYAEYAARADVTSRQAADALYWAARLDPAWPAVLLARREALFFARPWEWRAGYYAGASSVLRSREAREIDALYGAALLRHPFAYVSQDCALPDARERAEAADDAALAYLAYERGCFEQAAEWFARAAERDPARLGLRVDRARALYATQQYAGAAAEVGAVLAELRRRDDARLVHAYESKAMLEYMLGVASYALGELEAARAAFGRALAEEMGFYMAHVWLARVAEAEQDAEAALREYDLAVRLDGADPVPHYEYGRALLAAERAADAVGPLGRAVALAPEFALPYLDLATAYDRLDRRVEARVAYAAFVARAPRRLSSQLARARERLAALADR